MGKGGKWRGEEQEERRRKEDGGKIEVWRKGRRNGERDRGREGRRERVGGSVRMKAT
ncbi:hypothetical protein F2Q68_00033692 [Brassica cretica]|uniref:Uncharacterized protein n=2 Tax=Brassica cretica TaxID=69181 RepID=A0A8S9H1Q9_BRACR|nr:hypothetical protein F2Q68_00033692 [Brassica cretica]KAF3596890.1 hypothetical protein DY000_02020755 [Brassica cretica]